MTFNDFRGHRSGNMLTSTERHHTGPKIARVEGKIARVEGNVDTRKRDCSEVLLELDVALGFLLGFRTLEALNDNITQHFLHPLDAVSFRQLQKVSVLITAQSITVQYT